MTKRKRPLMKVVAFTILICVCIVLLTGCKQTPEKERKAHFVNSETYFPMLEEYIANDPDKHEIWKKTQLRGLDEWRKLIQSRHSSSN